MPTTTKSKFDKYKYRKSFYKDRKKLMNSYIPERLPGREVQIDKLVSFLSPIIFDSVWGNCLVYGSSGCGKTVVVKHVLTKELPKAIEQHKLKAETVYLNCAGANTAMKILNQILDKYKIKKQEYSSTARLNEFIKMLDALETNFILVLDEIDSILKKDLFFILYHLIRLMESGQLEGSSTLSVIGISNDLRFFDSLDERIKSSLSQEELIFPPYDALQLQEILKQRTSLALMPDTVEAGSIEVCAALSASEHGDARICLDLFRKAIHIAQNNGKSKITEDHVRKARSTLEEDRIVKAMSTLPIQSKLVLSAIILVERRQSPYTATLIYNQYRNICLKLGYPLLGQRRVSDLINEFDMLGLVRAKVFSSGRYGRKKVVDCLVSEKMIRDALRNDEVLDKLIKILDMPPDLTHTIFQYGRGGE